MPVRLFLGYFVVLAASATIACASCGIDGLDTPGSFAAAPPYPAPPYPALSGPGLFNPASAFPVHPHKLPKRVQVAQAE